MGSIPSISVLYPAFGTQSQAQIISTGWIYDGSSYRTMPASSGEGITLWCGYKLPSLPTGAYVLIKDGWLGGVRTHFEVHTSTGKTVTFFQDEQPSFEVLFAKILMVA